MRYTRITAIATALLILSTPLFADPAEEIEARFEQQLDEYRNQQERAEHLTMLGAGLSVLGFLWGSTIQTLDGAGYITSQTQSLLWHIGTATLSLGGGTTFTIGLLKWNRATEDYLKTLRRQKRYYNLLND
jgi:hypothetical protein